MADSDAGAVAARVPRVSIGMPVYNGAAFIRNALKTLLSQTESDFELVVSDNGSSDGSTEILLETAAADKRVRYFRQEKSLRAYDNFHYVLSKARAPYFMWAACDDNWDPDFIEKLANALDAAPEPVMAFCDVTTVTPTDKVGTFTPFDFATTGLTVAQRLSKLAPLQCYYFYGLWRTSAIRKAPYSYCAWWPDLPLMLAASMLGSFLYVPGVKFHYYEVPKSNLRRVKEQDYVDRFNLLMAIGGLIAAVYRACATLGGPVMGLYAAALVSWKQVKVIPVYLRRRISRGA
ncbi:MAG: glycosyltransferase [Polaromonas sp.]|nr:glycosyltransferase [Polaromonas sp.]